MFHKLTMLSLVIVFVISVVSFIFLSDVFGDDEDVIKVSGTVAFTSKNELDFRPLDPENDPDIDMFIDSWKHSIPFNTHGSITERAILSKCAGDPLKPERKGAVLKYINSLSRATLDPHASTTPSTLKGEQEIFYITSGKGVVKAGGKMAEIRNGIFVLMPAELEFTITNTGDELLIMYLVREPVPEGFRPNRDMLIRDECAMAYRDQGYLQGHWAHNGKNIFRVEDGLGTLESVVVITFNAMTIGQPHSHGEGHEEIWTLVQGRNLLFMGKEIRWQETGTAYKIPPTGFTPHSNINDSEEPIKFLFIARWRDHEVRK